MKRWTRAILSGLRAGASWRKAAGCAVLCASVLVLAGCSAKPSGDKGTADSPGNGKAALQEGAAAHPLPYDVKFVLAPGASAESKFLIGKMAGLSRLEKMKSLVPDGEVGLEGRCHKDVKTAVDLMHSEGYYDGTASFTLSGSETGHASVSLSLNPGRRYVVGDISLTYSPAPRIPNEIKERAKQLFAAHSLPGVETGKPGTAKDVLDAVNGLVPVLKQNGYPDARLVEQHYYLNRGAKTLNIALVLDPGFPARLGTPVVQGASDVNSEYIQSLVPWTPGEELWDSRRVDEYVSTLRKTGLFANVTSEVLGNTAGMDGIDSKGVGVKVADAPHRSIGGSLGYSTDTGFNAQGMWEHRNLFHNGEKLLLKAPVSRTKSGITGTFDKPDFLDRHQTLKFKGSALRELTDGYDTNSVSLGAGIERNLGKNWSVYGGAFADSGTMETNVRDEQGYSVYGLDMTVRRDTRSDPLNPVSGTVLEAGLKPMSGQYDGDFTAVASKLAVKGYYAPFTKDGKLDDKVVFAARAEAGAISGSELKNIAPSYRYYLGGAGSVRGYGYQQIGPMDKDDDPSGARSYQLVNLESRFHITKDFGLVAFLDGGRAYTSEMPEFSPDMDWGAGLGLRYFTPIGPVRLDIAVPLKADTRPPLQFYISIGQSF